jgi:hypothetical protein
VPRFPIQFIGTQTSRKRGATNGFEESAHEPPLEEPAKFNAAMAELVRPLVL